MNEVQEYILRRAMQKLANTPRSFYERNNIITPTTPDEVSRAEEADSKNKNLASLYEGSPDLRRIGRSLLPPLLGGFLGQTGFSEFVKRTSIPDAPEQPITDDTPLAPGITMGMYRSATPEVKTNIRKYMQNNNIYNK